MKYEQIVNKIILILFCRTLYRGSIYRTSIYNVKLDYSSVNYFHFTSSQYLSCKNVQKTTYSDISQAGA